MKYKELKKQILSVAQFTDNELLKICSFFKPNYYLQKDFIVTTGKISKEIHFIINGLIRVYYLKAGKEVTSYLATDNDFVSSYSSFINQKSSFENIQCIEECETLAIDYENMQELYAIISNHILSKFNQ